MISNQQQSAQAHSASDHIVQFFDAIDTLGASVSGFLKQGFDEGADALLIVRPTSVQAIARGLTARGVSLQALIESGRITIVDAAATLEGFMDGTRLDPKRFRAMVGSLLQQVAETSGARPRLYGEMVEVLATEGDFDGALELEDLWNDVAKEWSFTLLCGYLAAHFTGGSGHEALRSICDRHSHVQKDQADLLATWLLTQSKAAV